MSRESKTSIQLLHGEYFDPFHPDPKLINLDGVATSLSHLCRFTGNVQHFYSVAQHAVLVSQNCHPGWADLAVHHDDPEGLGLSDLPAPIKHTPEFEVYRQLEEMVMVAVCERFGIPATFHESVKVADRRMVFTEKRDLKVNDNHRWETISQELFGVKITPFDWTITPWPCAYAKEQYLRRHEEVSWLSLLSVAERNAVQA